MNKENDVIRYMGDEFPNVPRTIESLKRREFEIKNLPQSSRTNERLKKINENLTRLTKIKRCEKCNTETEPKELWIVNGAFEYWKAVCDKCFLTGLLPE